MKILRNIVSVVILMVGLALVSGCDANALDIGELQTKSTTVELGGAERVSADISMGAGKLIINGGSEALMDAQFSYNVAGWEPEVSYEVGDGVGRLAVDQPATREGLSLDLDEIRYDWDLQFSEDVPMDLFVSVGAGDSQLGLNSLQLDKVTFEIGAGDADIDLGGSTARDLAVKMGAGDVSMDLSGNWQQDLTATMKGGIGRITVILPSATGVQVNVQSGLGQVNADGLNRNGDVYTNDAYGQSEATLEIDIEGGVGEINLVLAE